MTGRGAARVRPDTTVMRGRLPYLALVPYGFILAGVGLSRFGVLPAMTGWMLTAFGVLSGLAVAITLIVVRRSRSWWAAALAVLPTLVATPMVVAALRSPPINDVATNVEAPLAFVAALQAAPNAGRDMSFPAENGPIIRAAYPGVRPLVLDEPAERVFRRIEDLAGARAGWSITRRDAATRTIEGEATTSVFRFVDDFVIHVADHDGGARIEMRSKSRDGVGDAGVNAERIRSFFDQLEDAP